METEQTEAAQEALAAKLVSVLRERTRDSAHPADQAALRQIALRMAVALRTEFLVLSRKSSS